MYTRSPPTAGKILKFCQPGKNLLADADEFIQPGAQVLHVGSIDPAIFIGYFGLLVQIIAAHLQEIRHAAQLRQIQIQTISVQRHFS